MPQLGGTTFACRDDIFISEKQIDIFSSHQPKGLMNRLMGHNMMRKDGDALHANMYAVNVVLLDDKGGIVLSDARAQPIVTFPVQAKGPYEAKAPDGRTWRLEPVKPGAPTPDEAPIQTAPPIG